MRGQSRTHAFEGVIPNMERRYKETESHAVRDELARYLSVHTCETCNGSRLREEARHVFIGDMAIHDISALPIDETVDYFHKLKLEGSRAEIAHRITQEIAKDWAFSPMLASVTFHSAVQQKHYLVVKHSAYALHHKSALPWWV